jgi:hypothetical protein
LERLLFEGYFGNDVYIAYVAGMVRSSQFKKEKLLEGWCVERPLYSYSYPLVLVAFGGDWLCHWRPECKAMGTYS